MVEERLFLDNINFYQFAAVVEDHILNQHFLTTDGSKISFSSRRRFDETQISERLELGANGNFFQRITLDCRVISSTPRLMVIAKCWEDSLLPAYQKILADIKLFWKPSSSSPASEPTPAVTQSKVKRFSKRDAASGQSSANQQVDGWGRPIQVDSEQSSASQQLDGWERPVPVESTQETKQGEVVRPFRFKAKRTGHRSVNAHHGTGCNTFAWHLRYPHRSRPLRQW